MQQFGKLNLPNVHTPYVREGEEILVRKSDIRKISVQGASGSYFVTLPRDEIVGKRARGSWLKEKERHLSFVTSFPAKTQNKNDNFVVL